VAILGDNSSGGASSNASSDRVTLSKVTASVAGTINSASIVCNAGNSTVSAKFVLYNASGGYPSSVVATSSAVLITGAGTFNFTMSGSFSAGDYYLGVVWNNFSTPDTSIDAETGLSGVDSQLHGGNYASPGALSSGTVVVTYTDSRFTAWIDYTDAVTLTQAAFRWRNDDGSESGATWAAAQNAAP
jgi:hypothetical protein